MTEQLDKKLREYLKKTLKQGHSKEQIRISLKRVGYDIGIVNKSFKEISKQRTLTNILLASLVVVLVVGLFMFWGYYLKPEPLVFLAEQPKEKFAQSNKSILLMSWYLPLEAQQNELINLTTVWKSQKEVNKDFTTVFSLVGQDGNIAEHYFFSNNRYPTSLRRSGYQYMEVYSFNAPYLKPSIYYYKIGLWDPDTKIISYSYNGTILGNLTVKEDPRIKPCGLIVAFVIPNSPAEKAGVRKGDAIMGINGEKLEFEKIRAENKFTTTLFGDRVINLETFELNTESSTYEIVKKVGEATGLRLVYKFCNIQK